MRFTRFLGCVSGVWLASVAHADHFIYAGNNSGLRKIDVDTGVVSQLPHPLTQVFNLAAGDSADQLYVSPHGTRVYSYLFGTGIGPEVGIAAGANALTEGRDGYLYFGSHSFSRLDPQTGVVSVINESIPQLAGDLATSSSGVMYCTLADLHFGTIDRLTGAINILGTTPVQFFGLAFTSDGRLWATGENSLYQIDPVTGVASLSRDLGFGVLDLASEPIPAPSTLALVVGVASMGARRARPSNATQ